MKSLKSELLETGNIQAFLQQELLRRCKSNPRYSLRAFARFLKIDASYLSKILSGERSPSTATLRSIGTAFGWKADEIQTLHQASKTARAKELEYRAILSDRLKFISDWYHYGILELVEVQDFQPSIPWIARTLNITELQAQEGLDRLIRLDLLEVGPQGRWKRRVSRIVNADLNSLESYITHQEQVLGLALKATREIPVDSKCQVSSILAIHSKQILPMKKVIYAFQDKLCQTLNKKSKKKDDVYVLSINLVPATTRQSHIPQDFSRTERLLSGKK